LEVLVKKFLLVALVGLFMFPTLPADAAPVGPTINLSACNAGNGTYTVTVSGVYEEPFWGDLHTIDPTNPGGYGDGSTCQGDVPSGWSQTFPGLPPGSTFSAYFWDDPGGTFKSITMNIILPPCNQAGAKPLFNMFLLTGSGKYCMLISEWHPSVERQKAACFPGQEWVAERTPCSGMVYDNGSWACDGFGFERLPLDRLQKVYEQHLKKLQQSGP
jgi:hypothetical protein